MLYHFQRLKIKFQTQLPLELHSCQVQESDNQITTVISKIKFRFFIKFIPLRSLEKPRHKQDQQSHYHSNSSTLFPKTKYYVPSLSFSPSTLQKQRLYFSNFYTLFLYFPPNPSTLIPNMSTATLYSTWQCGFLTIINLQNRELQKNKALTKPIILYPFLHQTHKS